MKNSYVPIDGFFDLSKLNLPNDKFKKYWELQKLGRIYQNSYAYHKQHNRTQLEYLKQLCTEMSNDLILNYGALELEGK